MTDIPSPTEAPPRGSSPLWLLLLVLIVISLGAMILLPMPYSAVLMTVLLLIGLLIVARDGELRLGRAIPLLIQFIRAPGSTIASSTAANTQMLTAVSIGIMILSTTMLRPGSTRETLGGGLIVMLIGAILLAYAIAQDTQRVEFVQVTDEPLTPSRSHWGAISFGVILLLLIGVVNGTKSASLMSTVNHTLQFAMLVIGVGVVVWGFSGAPRLSLSWIPWREMRPLLLIFVLAFGLRVVNLESSLRHAVDESVVIGGINHITSTKDAGLVTQTSAYLSATQVYPFLQTQVIQIFGRNFTGLRMMNVIVGSLTIFAVYLLTLALSDDRRFALLSAFMLAVFPPHIHFSRIALAHVTDPMFGTLMLAFITRGLKHNRRVDWALAGACLGMTQFFFEGGRLLFPILAVGWVGLLVLTQKRNLMAQWRGLVMMLLVALFVMMPVYYTIFVRDANRATRFSASSIGGDYFTKMFEDGFSVDDARTLAERIVSPFRTYVQQPELTWLYYGGNQALILEHLIPLFLLGAWYALARWRSPIFVIGAWIVGAALGNSIMRDMYIYPRYLVVIPALPIVLAIGLYYVLPMLAKDKSRVTMAVFAFAAVIGIGQLNYYYNVHLPALNQQLWNVKGTRDGIDAVLRMLPLPSNTTVWVLDDSNADRSVMRAMYGFFVGVPQDVTIETSRPSEFVNAYLQTLNDPNRNYAFFVEPDDSVTIAAITAKFPTYFVSETPYADVPEQERYLLYLVPKRPSVSP